MSKTHFGGKHSVEYKLKNPLKYVGSLPVISRSSWETKLMCLFDTHPCVHRWASETIVIPYFNPITKKQARYYPDFFVEYIDLNKNLRRCLIEVKPLKETVTEMAKSKRDKIAIAINHYKWECAKKWCDDNNIEFRVMTEKEIFGGKI